MADPSGPAAAQATDVQLRAVGARRRIAIHCEQQMIVKTALAGRTQTEIARLLGV